MEERHSVIVGASSLALKPEDSSSLPRTSFKDHVSRFGYSYSSTAQQISADWTDSSPPRSLSQSIKRKRSRASNLSQLSNTDGDNSDASEAESSTSKRQSTPRSRKASSTGASPASSPTPIVSKLRDSLRPNLTLVLVGLNPGIMTASLGHPYSHPSNGFWKTLYTSGITPIQHRPQDHPSLPDLYGIGNTNICARPSRQGSDLSKAELLEGAKILDDKITLYRPEAACISGKGVWEAMWTFKTGKKKMPRDGEGAFKYGWQDEELWLGRVVDEESREVLWKGAMTFVAPSTSGLNAGMSPTEKEQAWKPIGEWMRKKRMEREPRETNGTEEQTVGDIAAVVKHSEDLDSRTHSRGKKITPRA